MRCSILPTVLHHNASSRSDAGAFPCAETTPPSIIDQPFGRRRRGPGTHIEGIGWIAVRNSCKSRLALLALATVALWSVAIVARAQIVFNPSPPGSCAVLTTNNNDFWNVSRGVVFQATTTQTISNISLWQDLTGVTVNYEIDQTTGASGNLIPGKTVLRSGSNTFTTTGLQYITFPIVPLQLTAGNFYQVRFDFSANSNANCFFNNNGIAFSQTGFAQITGTQADITGTTALPQIALNLPLPSLPVLSPGMLAVLALLLAFASAFALRRRS